MIEAAGGVVWRRGTAGVLEILLVHRPRYDDWSLPKGKLDEGESHLAAALREVEEETGLRCDAGDELTEVQYVDRHERPKRVRFWAMQPVDGDFTPGDEVDEVRWVPLDDVAAVSSYPGDADVVADLVRGDRRGGGPLR